MFFRGSGGAGRRGMQGRGHIRRARTESGPGGAQGARDCFALVCPRHEASCSFSEKSRGLVFSKILPSRATFSKILLRDDLYNKTKEELSSFEGMKKKREKIMVATEPP